jgi:hypothetical protein
VKGIMFLILVLLLAFLSTVCGAYNTSFVKLFGAIRANTNGRGIKILPNGAIVVVGHSTRAIADQASLDDITQFVTQKYSSAGMLLWTRLFGSTTDHDSALTVDIDTSDNIYVAGHCRGTVDGVVNKGTIDMCFVKYDTNGNKQFSGQIGGTGHDAAMSIVVDNLSRTFYLVGQTNSIVFDNIFRTAYTDQVWIQFDCQTGTKLLTNHYGTDPNGYTIANGATVNAAGFLIVVGHSTNNWMGITNRGPIDSTDIFTWMISLIDGSMLTKFDGGSKQDSGYAVTTDAMNSIYTLGVSDSPTIDGKHSNGWTDVVVFKYSSVGTKLFTILAGGEWFEEAYGIATDASTNTLFVSGSTFSQNIYGKKANINGCGMLLLFDMTTGARKDMFLYLAQANGLTQFTGLAVRDRKIAITGYVNTAGVAYFGQPVVGGTDAIVHVLDIPLPTPTTPPTIMPTARPSTIAPSPGPTRAPTRAPSRTPTRAPTSVAPTIRPYPTPTRPPTLAPTSPVTWGQLNCPAFFTTKTNSARKNTVNCPVIACQGRTVRVSMCGGLTNNGGACSGDTFLRIFDPNGVQVASNDNSCGACSTATFKATMACSMYTIVQGCVGTTTCSGVSAVTFYM